MADYLVGSVQDISEGGRKIVQCGEHEVGIFRFKGQLYAWHNQCPHRQGPVCQGKLFHRVMEPVEPGGTVRTLQYDDDHLHLVCPWHGYEFDVATGVNAGFGRLRLRRAELRLDGDDLYVVL